MTRESGENLADINENYTMKFIVFANKENSIGQKNHRENLGQDLYLCICRRNLNMVIFNLTQRRLFEYQIVALSLIMIKNYLLMIIGFA